MKKVEFSRSVINDANEIVEKCMADEPAFCQSECPMHTDARGYVTLVAEKKYDEAIKLIRQELFLPNTLGRICPHPCERVCRRGRDVDQPIAIKDIKRFVAEKADKEEIWDLSTNDNTGKRVAIIGAGPAGAQAAIDLRKKGHIVTIFEKLNEVGGMMRLKVSPQRLPREIIDYEYSYLNKLGIKFELGKEIGKDIKFSELIKKYDVVLLAYGIRRENKEKKENKENNDDFIKDITFGIIEQTNEGRYIVDEETLSTQLDNVFVAGSLCGGRMVVESMALGRKAAISMDRFLKGIDLKENRDFTKEWSYETKLDIPLPEGIENKPRINGDRITGLTEEEAIKEASRCLNCKCGLCMNECIMMNDFGKSPKDIVKSLVDSSEINPLIPYSCSGCSMCRKVCPKSLPINEVFMNARKDFVKANKGESPFKGHLGVNIHQKLSFSKVFSTKKKGNDKS